MIVGVVLPAFAVDAWLDDAPLAEPHAEPHADYADCDDALDSDDSVVDFVVHYGEEVGFAQRCLVLANWQNYQSVPLDFELVAAVDVVTAAAASDAAESDAVESDAVAFVADAAVEWHSFGCAHFAAGCLVYLHFEAGQFPFDQEMRIDEVDSLLAPRYPDGVDFDNALLVVVVDDDVSVVVVAAAAVGYFALVAVPVVVVHDAVPEIKMSCDEPALETYKC